MGFPDIEMNYSSLSIEDCTRRLEYEWIVAVIENEVVTNFIEKKLLPETITLIGQLTH